MDRISALRNVEDAIGAFEAGDIDLATLEERVVGVVRTYATEFDGDAGQSAYRAHGEGRADGLVVAAADRPEARERVEELVGGDAEFELHELD
jgi:hypothetical protein